MVPFDIILDTQPFGLTLLVPDVHHGQPVIELERLDVARVRNRFYLNAEIVLQDQARIEDHQQVVLLRDCVEDRSLGVMLRLKVFSRFLALGRRIVFLIVICFVKKCVVQKIGFIEVHKRKLNFQSSFASVWVHREWTNTNGDQLE